MVNENFHSWRIGTINIRTGTSDEKLERVIYEIGKARLSVCCLQEVRRLNTNSVTISNTLNNVKHKYEVYWSGHVVKRQHGVGIAIKVDQGIEINEVTSVSARIIVADISIYGCSLRIICCYAPTEEDSESSKNLFYNSLKKQFNCEKTRKILCLGDFNASSSASWYNSSLRERVVVDNLIVNDNGDRFHEFFNTSSLSVLNTWFTHKTCRRITWHSPDRTTKKVYDFILACSWIRQYVKNCRVYNSYDFDSDHRLVIADLTTPCNKVGRYITRTVKPNTRLNTEILKEPETQTIFVNTVVGKLESVNLDSSSNTEINQHLVSSINSSAEEILPAQQNPRLYQPWHDDDILRQLYDLKDSQISQNANFKAISLTRKRIRLRSNFLRNEYFKEEAAKLNQYAIYRELDKLFSCAKKQETTLKQAPGKCPPQKILEHFKKHFNPENPSENYTPDELNKNIPEFILELREISSQFSINHDAPTTEEIQTHLHRLKSGKASNDVDPEILKKCEHPVMLSVIHRLTSNLWSDLDLPHAWGNSKLKTLWKGKGSKSDPSKYRGLSIGSTVAKLIIDIILERLRPWYEAQLSDNQNGFRKNRGTTDGIYTMKRVQQISHRSKQPLFLLFVDLTAAFDHIPRKWLFESTRLRFNDGENLKLLDILERLYMDTSLTYPEGDATFTVTSGVRQGGPESPFLFNIFMDFVMRVFTNKCLKDPSIHFFDHKYRINTRSISREERLKLRNLNIRLDGTSSLPWCGYADDLILFMKDLESLKRATKLLDEVFVKFGLQINETKTETMILNCDCLETDYPASIIDLHNTPLKNAACFKYLGSHVSQNEPTTGNTEINHRIQMAHAKFATMTNLLQNFRIHLKTRILFLNSFVRSRLTYSCQNWNLTGAQYTKLDVIYRNLLRRMLKGGFKRVDSDQGDFRYKLSNEKVHAICGTSDVSCFIKNQQKSFASHVVRMSNNRCIKQLMFNDDKCCRTGRTHTTLLEQVVNNTNSTLEKFINLSMERS